MGLDQWLEGYVASDDDNLPVRFGQPWRKWYALQEYMITLWMERTGSKELFNCIPLKLSKEDFNNLEKWIIENQDDEGADDDDNDDEDKDAFREQNREIIEEARSFMEENPDYVICYSCWW